ncbi:hypothetical protein GJW-30_1_03821 [Variibacter gotjawalensis]|uniref:DUF6456 domain-containing protein n=1 Tax=Variibacter gotjawalensis TaxID=1333996 RepID=A0A0S3PZW3_9BRAD|nr:DUF6456 domain-containing protein [Variibacter gotjawalensis]NIK47102.1 hypothetical protein [Variibacter gotjawalensis]RZS49004.1 hypothetical protein EV661_1428 [Variibacter gotjawalensis]BAT61264.1 hypothetical protein GJW-30_1_03821 [Variibacter gotjawalensis]
MRSKSPLVDAFRAQHLNISTQADGSLIDDSESPLAWLARRKGRGGQALITPHQFLAGERLRADFTRAQMTPKVTASWNVAVASGRRGEAGVHMTDVILAARQRVQLAVRATGPEFSGLLLDVCCFLKKLDVVETERGWPVRSAKVVLQLGLDRLARHYGLTSEAKGPIRAAMRAWKADET